MIKLRLNAFCRLGYGRQSLPTAGIYFGLSRHCVTWWHEFLNYFCDRVTQGFVEGINRAIRGIINRAFGFCDFGNFRLQVLVECGDT